MTGGPRSLLAFAPVLLAIVAAAGWATPAGAFPRGGEQPELRSCGDPSGDGGISSSDALLVLRGAVGAYLLCPAITCDVLGGADGLRSSDALAVLKVAAELASPTTLACPSAARVWNERLLAAIRRDIPRPTVHARNLFHLSVALWDAWVAYDTETGATAYLFGEKAASPSDLGEARAIAMSYASYRILSRRFLLSPGHDAAQTSFDLEMDAMQLDRSFESQQGDSPAALGNRIAAAVLAYGQTDGANEENDYADTTGYAPVNEPLFPALRGTVMADPNRWQPLSLDFAVTQNGIPLPVTLQTFIGPHWANVAPFALAPADPGPPPLLGGESDAELKDSVLEVIRLSARLDPSDGVRIDISPHARGNSSLGTNDGVGYVVNPATGQPYQPQMVGRADYGRVLAEFWADGPASETPPGHWNVLANHVADHPGFEKRLGGEGDVVSNLEWDVKTYLALNGAVHDAAIAAWGNKAAYDSARPISLIRHMAGLGQSSDSQGPVYHPDGLPLEEGLVEVITAESTAPGQRHRHLLEYTGQIAIRAWLGNPEDQDGEASGVGWLLGEDWVPYQRETFVTPAFAGYVSGHSTFSRAAAEALTLVTGSAFFPDGLGEFHAAAGTFLEFEHGPAEPLTLQWATYQDAADEAGFSRLYGGIHIRADDLAGRILGYRIGRDAADLAALYWTGTLAD